MLATSKIAFISSDQGGMDIEDVASKSPEKILTTKVELKDEIELNQKHYEKLIDAAANEISNFVEKATIDKIS